ncbi:Uncharacterised protein [Mycobacterium tuberculosis]|nr:Uncharacterised protein [Mycobacterium tuberculosis]
MPAPRKAQPNAMSPRPNTVLSNVTAAATAKGTKNSPARDSATPLPATTMGGMIFCTTATPMLPPAAFRPSAQPLSFSG